MKNNKNNIKQNMLSLKALKAELEQLKSNHKPENVASQNVTTSPKGNHTIITKFQTMKSSMFILWMITTLISYAHKYLLLVNLLLYCHYGMVELHGGCC